MSTDVVNLAALEADYDQDELFQDAPVEFGGEGDREWAYPLTSFVPAASSPIGSRTIPEAAAYWIVPDVNNVKLVRILKLFRTTFVNKVPPSYNVVFMRVNRHNQLNPTEFQEALRSSVLTKFPDKDGRASVAQTYYLPVIRRYKGEWAASIAELSVKAYNEIRKEIASAEDNSDGRITPLTRPMAIWKPAQREIEVRFDNKFDGSVKDIIAQFKDEMIDPGSYIKLRASMTEKWLREQWTKFNSGAPLAMDANDFTDRERFTQQVMDLSSPQLKQVLAEAGVELNGARTKPAMAELVVDNDDKTRPIVESLLNAPPF